jgi:thiol-disulfide isomerase/thioredoxin
VPARVWNLIWGNLSKALRFFYNYFCQVDNFIFFLSNINIILFMTKPIKITLFHADWCGHCVDFMPTWERMKKDKNARKNIEFEEYEAATLPDLPEETRTVDGEKIDGFPTIKITINDNEYNYMGNRSSDDIYEFIVKELRQSLKNPEPGDPMTQYHDTLSGSSSGSRMRGGNGLTGKNQIKTSKKTYGANFIKSPVPSNATKPCHVGGTIVKGSGDPGIGSNMRIVDRLLTKDDLMILDQVNILSDIIKFE